MRVFVGVTAAVLAGATVLSARAYFTTAYDADVNRDGLVTAADLGVVASYFGRSVPTPTPTVTPVRAAPIDPSMGLVAITPMNGPCSGPVYILQIHRDSSGGDLGLYVSIGGQNYAYMVSGQGYFRVTGYWRTLIIAPNGIYATGALQDLPFSSDVTAPVSIQVSAPAHYIFEKACATPPE